MIGSQLGSYEILEEIGRGGMGRVYKARQPSLNRIVAVKVLLPQLAADEVFVERFLREARSIATLEHPGIVTIYDVGESEGIYYFAMQLLDGRPLDEVLDGGEPLPLEEAVEVTRRVARALEFAHASGILHRDVKPGNIILTETGGAVLTDFGIAQAASDTRLTKTGTSIGSPEYMAPEQIEGKPLDGRADLYSLGVVFFQMLTGEVPYKGDSAVSIVYQHVKAPVPSARELVPWIPEKLDRIVTKTMAKLPEQRYASAAELLEVLDDDELTVPMVAARAAGGVPRWAWAAGAAGLALAALATLWLSGRSPEPAAPPAPEVAVESGLAGEGDAVIDGGVVAAEEPTAGTADGSSTGTGDEPRAEPAGGSIDGGGDESLAGATDAPELPPPAPAATSLRVTSAPAGATVVLDDRTLDGPTPVEVELLPDTEYRLEVRLDGHEAAGWTFSLADLSDVQRGSGVLHFPLRSSVPPGVLEIVADYPVRLVIGERSFDSSRVELPPGEHSVSILAPSVFHAESRQVRIASGETAKISLPATTQVHVAANPSRCRVKIDGQDAGYLPAKLELTLGEHEFEFDWESLGKSLMLTRSITPRTDRVFATAP